MGNVHQYLDISENSYVYGGLPAACAHVYFTRYVLIPKDGLCAYYNSVQQLPLTWLSHNYSETINQLPCCYIWNYTNE